MSAYHIHHALSAAVKVRPSISTRVATQSAELGTFDFDLKSGALSWDQRCRELFGIYTDEPVTYERDFLPGLHEEDRDRIALAIDHAFKKESTGGDFDEEYRTVGTTDKRLRWVKANGKVFFDDNDQPVRFIGSVLDITQQKLDEQRKNDFIAIISHELKTPLTSIKSYIQLVLNKARKGSDTFVINALTRADIQSSKMASMIKDFLILAQIEQGQLKLIKETFNLSAMLEDSVTEAKLRLGISLNDQRKLFTRFYRVENERSKTISGFGIGLFIVSAILRYYESKIQLDSVVGKGSKFFFYLEKYSAKPRLTSNT